MSYDDNPCRLANIIVRKAFAGKTDKAGVPYINHLVTVAQGARGYISYGHQVDDKDIECTALLHDLLEDCPEWTEGALRTLFSETVVDAVVALTKKPQSESYREYILRVAVNPLAKIVKLADLKHNMDITRQRSFNDVDIEKLQKYHQAYITLKNINS
jgi:(p)ppGpp synthase/HD superfamily hydrolase